MICFINQHFYIVSRFRSAYYDRFFHSLLRLLWASVAFGSSVFSLRLFRVCVLYWLAFREHHQHYHQNCCHIPLDLNDNAFSEWRFSRVVVCKVVHIPGFVGWLVILGKIDLEYSFRSVGLSDKNCKKLLYFSNNWRIFHRRIIVVQLSGILKACILNFR